SPRCRGFVLFRRHKSGRPEYPECPPASLAHTSPRGDVRAWHNRPRRVRQLARTGRRLAGCACARPRSQFCGASLRPRTCETPVLANSGEATKWQSIAQFERQSWSSSENGGAKTVPCDLRAALFGSMIERVNVRFGPQRTLPLIVSCTRHSTIDRNGFSEPPSVYRRRLPQCQHRARHFHLSNRGPRHALRRALLLLSWASNQQHCAHKLRNAQISSGLSRY